MTEKRIGYITEQSRIAREENAQRSELLELLEGAQWKPGELARGLDLLDAPIMKRLAARMYGD